MTFPIGKMQLWPADISLHLIHWQNFNFTLNLLTERCPMHASNLCIFRMQKMSLLLKQYVFVYVLVHTYIEIMSSLSLPLNSASQTFSDPFIFALFMVRCRSASLLLTSTERLILFSPTLKSGKGFSQIFCMRSLSWIIWCPNKLFPRNNQK